MANRKTSKHNAGGLNRSKLLVILAIVVGVLLILWAGWWLIFKHNAYTPDKETVRRNAKGLYDVVALKGDEVYSTFSDVGCDDSHAVGISTDIYCSFVGYKYFESDGPLLQNLKAVDAEIRGAGWRRTFNSQNSADIEYILSDSNNQTVSYLSPNGDPEMVVSLGYYKSDASESDSYLQRLVRNGTVKAPANGKYLYGIRVGATYWSCRSDSLFKVCPLPPSAPKSTSL